MKKLEIFDYITKATDDLELKREVYTRGAAYICGYLEKAFENNDEVVGVTYRIKTSPSLKEKIIRNNLYKAHTALELVASCSDIIGVRVECRFLSDEKTIYSLLRGLFCVDEGDGYFCTQDNSGLRLKMGCPQPEVQKNGHEIFRIDGDVMIDGEKYNYELQIKSLVNSFWSEIEHKIIYKNKRFMMIDGFVNELMSTINDNLKNIDEQLNMLFKRCLDNSHSSQLEALENMLISFINELYSNVVEKRAGVSVSIKPYSESLVKYIFGYSSFKNAAGKNRKGGDFYGGTIVNVMQWMKTIDFRSIAIGEEIALKQPIKYENKLQRAIGEKIIANINTDFFCNTFFHILFSLEVGDDIQDFLTYVKYYEYRVAYGKTHDAQVRIKFELDKVDIDKMLLEKEIARIAEIV